MSDYSEPLQSTFNSALATIKDIIETKCPTLISKVGSSIYELIIRPLSYVYAWFVDNADAYVDQANIAYLQTSTETDNPLADKIASNYFVTRRHGTYAKGIVTITTDAPYARIPSGSRLTIGGSPAIIGRQCILTSGEISSKSPNADYITLIPVGNSYIAGVPVTLETMGNVEIPAGSTVTVQFSNNFIKKIELTSPVSGGSGPETDASMMQRCAWNTAAANVGTLAGLRQKFQQAPITVVDMAVVASEDAQMYRGRYNNTNINPGGYVDCYVETRVQEATIDVEHMLADGEKIQDPDTGKWIYNYEIDLSGCEGAYAVLRVMTDSPDAPEIESYKITYGSMHPDVEDAAGARLSCAQTMSLEFMSLYNNISIVTTTIAYMPNVKVLQDFIDSDDNTFVGQDIQVKAAIPVDVTMSCQLTADHELDDAEYDRLRETIATYVNDIPVGTASLNFSDIRRICADIIPDCDLRLPCIFGASCYLRDGTRGTWYSDTGVLNIADPVNKEFWSYKLSFFSLAQANIRLEQIR